MFHDDRVALTTIILIIHLNLTFNWVTYICLGPPIRSESKFSAFKDQSHLLLLLHFGMLVDFTFYAGGQTQYSAYATQVL